MCNCICNNSFHGASTCITPGVHFVYDGGGFPTFIPGSVLDVLNYAYYILSIISFLSVWVGTVALLVHYSKKVGMAKFWIALILPLAFYVGQIAVIAFQIPVPFIKLDPVSFIFYYRVVFTVSSTIGGVLFSMPFPCIKANSS